VQIVGYNPPRPGRTAEATRDDDQTPGPAALHVADETDIETIPLTPGTELAYTLDERHCAGRHDDTHHYPCPNDDAPYCPQHTDRWPCARCQGDCNLPIDACTDEHAVYLAAFAPDTFKVGVTRSWRLQTRLREQGADRGAHIHTVADGRIARRLEAEYAQTIADRVRTPAKLRSLASTVDDTAWQTLLDDRDVIDTYRFDYDLDLSTQPVHETIATGTVLGVKGRIVVLAYNGTTYAVDARDLVGHDVTPRAATRDTQSSLDSFSP
jgi:hypothetical protein